MRRSKVPLLLVGLSFLAIGPTVGIVHALILATATATGNEVTFNPLPTPPAASAPAGGAGGGGGSSEEAAPPQPPPPPPPPPPPSIPAPSPASTTVGPGGGQADVGGGAGVDGGVTVNVTPGAFGDAAAPVQVSIRSTPPPGVRAPQGAVLLNKTIEVNVPGSGIQLARTQAGVVSLQKPLQVMANLTAADLSGRAITAIGAGRVNASGDVDPLPTTVINPADGVISFTVTHLSTFTLFAVTTPGPTLAAPASGSRLNNLGPLLEWTSPAGAGWFHLEVLPFNDDGPGINLVIGDSPQVAASRYQVMAPDFGETGNFTMLPDMTYVWKVRTSAAPTQPVESDWTAWSNPRMFRTSGKTSATIDRVAPDGMATVPSLNQVLQWRNADRAVFYYEVQVSPDPNFSSVPGAPFLYWELRHGGETSPPNSYTIPDAFPLQAGTTYHWRVRPRVQGDGSPVAWSQTWSFKTR